MVAGRMVLCLAVAGLLCGAAVAAEEVDARGAEVLRLIEALEKAGLKVSPAEEVGDEDGDADVDEAAFEEILKKLEKSEISVDYTDASLGEVLGNLQKIAGVNLLLDPRVEKARDDSVTMKLEGVKPISVLRNLLKMFDLIAVYGDDALIVTLPSSEEPVTLVYDVHGLTEIRDFPYPGKRLLKGLESEVYRTYFIDEYEEKEVTPEPKFSGEKLIELLEESTPNGRWDDGPYSMTYANGILIVTQRPDVQIHVANIIMALKTRR